MKTFVIRTKIKVDIEAESLEAAEDIFHNASVSFQSEQGDEMQWEIIDSQIEEVKNNTVKEKLITEVINQIKKDIEIGDHTAIFELLEACPEPELIAFLPEETWSHLDRSTQP